MSLFEDNAEYAYGYLLGQDSIRNELKDAVKALLDKGVATKACEAYLKDADSKERSRKVSDDLLAALEGVTEPEAVMIRENKEFVAGYGRCLRRFLSGGRLHGHRAHGC